MMKRSSVAKTDTFTDLIEQLNRGIEAPRDVKQQSQAPRSSYGAFAEAVQQDQQRRAAPEQLLHTLAAHGPMTVPQLMAATKLSVTDLLESLRAVREAGLVTLEGAAGEETVTLSTSGQHVVALDV
jgi:hypothetical protein